MTTLSGFQTNQTGSSYIDEKTEINYDERGKGDQWGAQIALPVCFMPILASTFAVNLRVGRGKVSQPVMKWLTEGSDYSARGGVSLI